MKNALQRVGLHKFTLDKIEVVERKIICIDKNGNITRSEFKPAPSYSKFSKFGGGYDDYDDYYSAYEELLIEKMAHCFNADENNIILLLEYGYSVSEVEEMLMDTDLLHEALRDVKIMCGEEICEECCGGVF